MKKNKVNTTHKLKARGTRFLKTFDSSQWKDHNLSLYQVKYLFYNL